MSLRLTISHGILALAALILMANAADAAELVMFRRDGCPWCAKWDREIGPIYPKTEFNLRAPVRQVNLDRGRDPSIVHAPIHYTPTFVLIEDGKEVGRIEGYPGDEFFWVGWRTCWSDRFGPLQGIPRETFRRLLAPARLFQGQSDEGPHLGVVSATPQRRRSSFRQLSTSTSCCPTRGRPANSSRRSRTR